MKYEQIKTPKDLYIFMERNIKYGFVTSYKKTYTHKNTPNVDEYEKILEEHYKLQTPEELLNSKCGLCYDQVEFERKWFKDNNYQIKTYFTTYHNHAFLIFKDNNKYKLFERTYPNNNGIFSFDTLNNTIKYYKNIQAKNNNIDPNDIILYEYKIDKYGYDFYEFIKHATDNPKYLENNDK